MEPYPKSLRQFATLMACVMLLSLMISAGCTSSKPSYSGFLNDYSKLQPDPMEKEGAMFWINPDVSLKTYKKFIIEPISFRFSPELEDQAKNVDEAVLNDISKYFKDAIANSLAPEYSIVDESGHDVARLRIALTSVNVSRKDLKLYQYIPVALVLTGVGEATGMRDSLGILTMEGEALDSISGKRVAAVVQKKANEVDVKKQDDLTAADVYPTLDYWAKKMKDRLLSAK